MQVIDEIEKTLLDEHGIEYKYFTRLILSLSIGMIAFIVTYTNQVYTYKFLLLLALIGFFLASLFGVLLQHKLMVRPLDDLQMIRKAFSQINQDQQAITFDREPSKIETIYYTIQIYSFLISFLPIILFFIVNLNYR